MGVVLVGSGMGIVVLISMRGREARVEERDGEEEEESREDCAQVRSVTRAPAGSQIAEHFEISDNRN